jgi:3-deoxy-D-manno-octulosonic-acid transferase
LVLVETELWPSWIAAAQRRGIPVILVSARVSDRSYPRYRRFGWVVARTLRRLAAVGARTPEDAERFRVLGAHADRVSVTGDLKIDLDCERQPMAPDLDHAVGDRSLFVAGSTHEGEDAAALDALRYIESEGISVSLVLAPRHIERTPEIARIVRAAGWKPRLRSALGDEPLQRGEVLVLDTVGELASLYARSDVAFVGGSLVPVGGHNVIEPVLAGRPVVYGQYTANVRHVVEILSECGAGRMLSTAAELGPAVAALLMEPERASGAARRGREALMRHRGSSERTAALIEEVIMAASIGNR